jgi:hypothetical protein
LERAASYGSDRVLVDAGDIVVHLFKPAARTMHGLEKIRDEDLDEADQVPSEVFHIPYRNIPLGDRFME